VTLSPPVRMAAIVSALFLTGLAGFLFLLGRGSPDGSSPAARSTPVISQPAAQPTPSATTPAAPKPVAHRRPVTFAPGFPDAIGRALRYNRVVVVAVYVPGASVDAFVRKEARAAAKMSRAADLGLSPSRKTALERLVSKTGLLPDPAVVVIRRPGEVAATLSVADRQTIAQAVLQAKVNSR